MVNRRDFLKISAMAGAGLAASTLLTPRLFAFSQTTPLRKFLIGLPGLGPGGANEMGNYIPVLSPDTTTFRGSDLYRITMGQFTQHLHPDLPGPTKLWGYADAAHPDQKYLGGVIVANRNRAVRLNVKNNLPDVHPLPIDTSIMGADGAANRATVHLHGGMVPWTVDGGPHSWFTPTSTGPNNGAGPSFLNFGDQPGTANYYYPNSQSARLVWYHDHALGTTRLNAYSGLA
ncbi:MAG TPA: twin-arginine translocation signal domain-containing protein, partial [Terriglobales bacterium]